ncbi:MAG: TrbG/VirB9 family P-type conjugative transfer protein [Propionivibrio sp.]
MRNTNTLMRAVVLAFSLVCALPTAYAEIKPIPMPGDTRLVEFPYEPNDTFVVLTRPKSVTDIVLHPDEEVVGLALGDTFQWQVKDTRGHIFIKPLRPNISTSVTLVTSVRSYQFTLQASPEDGVWYQRVSFTYPQLLVIERERQESFKRAELAEKARLDSQVVTPKLSLENLNFEYTVKGEATFRPTQVFDDGKFTWVRMPKTQDMPAFFMVSEDQGVELINTNLRGDYVVVQRLVDKLLLKLGKTEITIERNGAKKGGWSLFN